MKYTLIIAIFVATIVGGIIYFNQHPFNINDNKVENNSTLAIYNAEDSSDCDVEGNAVSKEVKALNRLKNRATFPDSIDFDNTITLEKLIEKGNDKYRWHSAKAARIRGYVANVKPGGIETCNCKNKNIDDRDTHIELIINPNDNEETKRFIIEVTPRIRKMMKSKGFDWSTRALRDDYLGRFVEIEGWLMFDSEHESQAENTNPGRGRNWRATAWEIHPITKITKLDRNPNLGK
jgi:hypothetical protein